MEIDREVKEALDRATESVKKVSGPAKTTCIALIDAVSQLARKSGVPNAVEPEKGEPKVETDPA